MKPIATNNSTMKARYRRKANCSVHETAWIPPWTYRYLVLCAGLLIGQSARPQVSSPMPPPLTNQESQMSASLAKKVVPATAGGQLPPSAQRAFDKSSGSQAGEKRPATSPTGGTLPAGEQRVLDKTGTLQTGAKRPATGPAGGTLPGSEQRVFDKTGALQTGEKRPATGPVGGTLPASEQRSFDKNTPENQ